MFRVYRSRTIICRKIKKEKRTLVQVFTLTLGNGRLEVSAEKKCTESRTEWLLRTPLPQLRQFQIAFSVGLTASHSYYKHFVCSARVYFSCFAEREQKASGFFACPYVQQSMRCLNRVYVSNTACWLYTLLISQPPSYLSLGGLRLSSNYLASSSLVRQARSRHRFLYFVIFPPSFLRERATRDIAHLESK